MASYWRSVLGWLATSSLLHDEGLDIEKREPAPHPLESAGNTPSSKSSRRYTHPASRTTHASFAPIIFIPGAGVNSSFMLLAPPPPTLRRRGNLKGTCKGEASSAGNSFRLQTMHTPQGTETGPVARRTPYTAESEAVLGVKSG